jgi:DNA-binding transcriptional MocR family regulator
LQHGCLTGSDGSTLQYGPTRGYQPLLEAIAGLLADRGIHAGLDQLMITSGSQQGIDLAGRVLVSPGEVVLVELPTVHRGDCRVQERTGRRRRGATAARRDRP